VTAIEDRDGVRFYVERTSPLKPIELVRTPGLTAIYPSPNGAGRSGRRAPASVTGRPARLAGSDRRPARGRRRAGGRRCPCRAEVVEAAVALPSERRSSSSTISPRPRAARRNRGARAAAPPAGPFLYSTVTAALLWPAPGAIRFDAPAPANARTPWAVGSARGSAAGSRGPAAGPLGGSR